MFFDVNDWVNEFEVRVPNAVATISGIFAGARIV